MPIKLILFQRILIGNKVAVRMPNVEKNRVNGKTGRAFLLYPSPVLRDKGAVQARFLLGPAGTGKTFLCLEEIRRSLLNDPQGPPLILLAPKQATFQLERQLLADPALPGYTRLHILSFERLAEFVLDHLHQPPPPLLSEDGRTMVLHALLARRRKDLQIFHASAGLAGFARQLSLELRELQRHQLSPAALLELASRPGLAGSLRRKLHDLSLLLGAYLEWLRRNNLQDADYLLDLAALALGKIGKKFTFISALWLDGFAELTPQELTLLSALAPLCQKMTLAFCLDRKRNEAETPWLSIWSGTGRTWRQCWAGFSALPGAELSVDVLPRNNPAGRFAASPALRHLEEHWDQPKEFSGGKSAAALGPTLRVAVCDTAAAEAVLAAREILAFVRAGGRFREAAVLLRRMEGYHDDLRRVFSRYQIPFFLDRREPVAHHPLAELTRSSLRAAARGWQHDDWLSALKSGLVSDDDAAVDQMENEALERGWKGEAWFAPFRGDAEKLRWAERRRASWIAPFARFRNAVSPGGSPAPNGAQLAAALRELWRDLDVEKKLAGWSGAAGGPGAAVHATVWQQMNAWLDDLALAFAGESLPLRDWLPILEAGLGGLSVGVIPPVMDQVLIGAIDRSRNPELKLALLLGVNEKIFPAPPPSGNLLNEPDREELRKNGTPLGHDTREFLSREQFFGYIACTRSSRRLVVTCARRDSDDQPLNPSWFISRLRSLFSDLEIENFSPPDWTRAEHPCELAGKLIADQEAGPVTRELLAWPVFAPLRARLKSFQARLEPERLSPELAAQLHGPALRTSVSRLEQFAACAFQFFVHSGLRAEERQFFELDVKERGSFQHEALARFHQQLQSENKRWRDITPGDARQRMGRIVAEMTPSFRDGLMDSSAQSRFSARVLAGSLQDFAAAMVQWMSQYQFDPREAELGFGMAGAGLPAWELDLGGGRRLLFRGIIDRIDLCRPGAGDEALAVVVDYKSGARKLDRVKMAHGLQLQLAAYLSVLRHLADPQKIFGAARLIPAGVFYVNLRGQFERGRTRSDVLREREVVRQSRYQHSGRFDFAALRYLDNRGLPQGTQFKFRLKKDGEPMAGNTDLMPSAQFRRLLDQVEAQLVRMGREIYSGEIGLNPFQKGRERACDKCDYQGICRFDPWTHSFRVLAEDEEKAKS
jgi:ATP-dependent helicase/nuclease subunit B